MNTKLTFENLEKQSSLPIQDQGDEILVNKEFWNNNNFLQQLFTRRQFTNDEIILKNEFFKWHKELGSTLYDIKQKRFYTKREKNVSMKRLTSFMSIHPLLTIKDKKKIDLIKNEIDQSYYKHFIFGSLIGGFVLLGYLSIRFKKSLNEMRKYAIQHKFKTFFTLLFAYSSMNIYFVTRKVPVLFTNSMTKKGLTKKYFEDYLSEDVNLKSQI
jgi:hypothetical protein